MGEKVLERKLINDEFAKINFELNKRNIAITRIEDHEHSSNYAYFKYYMNEYNKSEWHEGVVPVSSSDNFSDVAARVIDVVDKIRDMHFKYSNYIDQEYWDDGRE